MRSKKNYKIISNILRVILHTFLVIGGLVMIFPFIWMIISSFKPSIEVISIPFKILPTKWTLSNYLQVFDELPMVRAYINSLIVSLLITFLVLFSSSAGGYLFAKLRFKGREPLFFFTLASMMIPPQIGIIPLFFLMSRLHTTNSYIGLIFPFAMSAFGIFIMRQFISGIPNSLIDAARIDGASDFIIYLKVILPMTKSAFSVLGILTFIWSWDEFLWPLVIISGNEMKTLPLVLGHFTQAESNFPGQSMAASALVIVPVLIVYAFFQRNFVKGMSMTGMKY